MSEASSREPLFEERVYNLRGAHPDLLFLSCTTATPHFSLKPRPLLTLQNPALQNINFKLLPKLFFEVERGFTRHILSSSIAFTSSFSIACLSCYVNCLKSFEIFERVVRNNLLIYTIGNPRFSSKQRQGQSYTSRLNFSFPCMNLKMVARVVWLKW